MGHRLSPPRRPSSFTPSPRAAGPAVPTLELAPGPAHALLEPIPDPSAAPPLALPRRSASDPTTVIGLHSRAVSTVLLGVTGIGAFVGAPLAARAAEPTDATPADATLAAERLRTDVATFESSMHHLTAKEIELARKKLWSAYVEAGGIETTPIAAATLTNTGEVHVKTRGEKVLEDLANRIEKRMRITARDMAHPESVEFLEGHPGYKKLSEAQIKRMVVDALKNVPIGELPGGDTLAPIIRALPNAGDIDAKNMSYNELVAALGDAQTAWLKEKFGPFLEEHKVEAAVVAAGAITAIRYASPEAAGLMDRVAPKVTVWRGGTDDGSLGGRARLAYRDRHVLPDLDLSGTARTEVGGVRLRASAGGTLSVEGAEHATGRLGLGARVGDSRHWADLSGTVDHRGRTGADLELGLRHPEDDLSITSRVTGRFGDGAAVDPSAAGRIRWELDVSKKLELRGADGHLGVFAGYGVDTTGRNDDFRVGVAFTLRW